MTDRTDSASLFQNLVKSSILIFAGGIVGVGAMFLTRLLAARHLSPGPYGTLVLGITVLDLLYIVSLLGLYRGFSREIPRDDDPVTLASAGLYVPVGVALALAVVVVVGADALQDLFQEPGLSVVLRILMVGLPFTVFVRASVGVFRGFGDSTGRVITRNFLNQALVLAAVAAGVAVGIRLYGLAVLWTAALVTSGIGTGWVLIHRIDGLSLSRLLTTTPASNRDRVRTLVAFSLPLMIAGVTARMLSQVDNLILGFFETGTDVALYDASFMLGMAMQLLTGSFGYLVLPMLSDLHANSRVERMDRIYKLGAKWMLFLALPWYALVLTRPNRLVGFVFGSGYASADQTILLLIASGFFVTIALGLNSNALTATGHTRTIMIANVTALVLNVCLNLVLIPEFGAVGAAVASFVSLAFINLFRSTVLYRYTGLQPFYRRSLGPGLGSAILMAGTYVLLGDAISNPLVLFVLYGVVHLVAIAALGGIEHEDLALVGLR